MKKIRTLLPGFGFFMVSEVGEGLSPAAEIGQDPCLWLGAYSLRDYHSELAATRRSAGVDMM